MPDITKKKQAQPTPPASQETAEQIRERLTQAGVKMPLGNRAVDTGRGPETVRPAAPPPIVGGPPGFEFVGEDLARIASTAELPAVKASEYTPKQPPKFDMPKTPEATVPQPPPTERTTKEGHTANQVAAPDVTAGGTPVVHTCRNCGHDLAMPAPSEMPTAHDKLVFQQAWLGGIPFRKKFLLLGGGVEIEFRSLLADEMIMVEKQLLADIDHSRIIDRLHYMTELTRLTFCLGLASIRSEKGLTYIGEDHVNAWKTEEPPEGETKLFHIREYIYNHVVTTESQRRVLGLAYYNFNRLVEYMEGHSSDPDFWKAAVAV